MDRLLLAFAVASGLLFCGVARGEEPQFGACWRDNRLCIAPRVAAPAMSVAFDTGAVQFGVIPGFGYGAEWVGPKVRIGGSVLLNTRETAVGQRVALAGLVDFMRYIHTGPMLQFGDRRWFWLVTLGTDLGAAATGKP